MSDDAKVIGDASVPAVFADEALLFNNINGTVRITLGSIKPETPVMGAEVVYVAIGRLVMTIAGAQRLSLALHDFLVNQGLDPSTAFRGDQTAQ